MGNAGTQHSEPPDTASTDLWKFFETRGAEQKESMFKLVTWIVGFAAVVLGFAVKEGFGPGLEKIVHPRMLFILGCSGSPSLLMLSSSCSITAGTLTGRLRGPTQREMVSPLLEDLASRQKCRR